MFCLCGGRTAAHFVCVCLPECDLYNPRLPTLRITPLLLDVLFYHFVFSFLEKKKSFLDVHCSYILQKARCSVCVGETLCSLCLTHTREGPCSPGRESEEPKQRAVDQSEASWPQQPPRLTAPTALKS